MALHGFNDAGWAQYKGDRKYVHGGKRQIHLRKNFTRKGRASSGGGSASYVLITENIAACSWNDIDFELTPATVSVIPLNGDGTLAGSPIDVENGLPDSVLVDEDYARIGIVVGGKLIHASCNQVNYAPEEP